MVCAVETQKMRKGHTVFGRENGICIYAEKPFETPKVMSCVRLMIQANETVRRIVIKFCYICALLARETESVLVFPIHCSRLLQEQGRIQGGGERFSLISGSFSRCFCWETATIDEHGYTYGYIYENSMTNILNSFDHFFPRRTPHGSRFSRSRNSR